MSTALVVLPRVAHHRDPFGEVSPDWEEVPIGTRLCDVMPVDVPCIMMRINGDWILREGWELPLMSGDILEVHYLPTGGDSTRKYLRLIIQIVVAFATSGASIYWQAAINIGTALALNALLPIKGPPMPGAGEAASPTYSTSLSGNQARLDQPIPVIYGRMRVFPNFAAEPYTEFDADGDQFYFAVLCIGMGSYVLERAMLDDTPLSHFDDVEWQMLAPGANPTLALANVTTAPEVSGQDMPTGLYIGGFAASQPETFASAIGVDFIFPRGLGTAEDSGGISNRTVQIRVEHRTVDSWGMPTSAWGSPHDYDITDNTTTPVRKTFKYTIPLPARVEVRAVRVDIRSDSAKALNDVTWTGLRAYLLGTPALANGATHFAVRMRASEQLNGLSQRLLAVIVRRKIQTWNPSLGWVAETEQRSPVWSLVDKWRNDEYGDGLPDDRIDLATMYDLAVIARDRQDRLDIVFDAATDSDTADQLIARSFRSRVFRRNGVRTAWRDEQADTPVTAYSGRDMAPGSATLTANVDVDNLPDGLTCEYFSNRVWGWKTFDVNAPGLIGLAKRREFWRIAGVTGLIHATREAKYEIAARVLRRQRAEWTTELQGFLPSFGSPVVFSPPLRGWGQHGDVVWWIQSTLTATLSEAPIWKVGATHYITMIYSTGNPNTPVVCTPGPTEFDVVLASDPGNGIPSFDDDNRERTKFVFGQTSEHRRIAIITSIQPQEMRDDGAMMIGMQAVIENDAVHTQDISLLPAPGVIQDPVDSPNDDGEGGLPPPGGGGGGGDILYTPRLLSHSFSSTYSSGVTDDPSLSFTLVNNGTFFAFVNEWVYPQPAPTSATGGFQVRVTKTSGTSNAYFQGSALSTWLPLNLSRTYTMRKELGAGSDYATAKLKVEIRDVASGTVQASNTFSMSITFDGGGGG
jgi:hypothetical protein